MRQRTISLMTVIFLWLQNIRKLWLINHRIILWSAIAVVTLLGSIRFFNEWQRLLINPERAGAIDLLLRHGELERWFSGVPVYTDTAHSGYPPASYVLLYPFFGWLGEWEARWFWGAVTLVELLALVFLLLKQSGAQSRLERGLIVVTLLMSYPIPITIGNGQIGLHVVFPFLAV